MTLIHFDDPQALDVACSGGKGSTLARLAARGLPVPGGFIVSTDAFTRFLDDVGVEPGAPLADIQRRILEAPLPDDVGRAIARALDDLESGGRQLWAVRSSAVAEDTREASFAGQYETLLGLRGSDDVIRAVLRCWAAAFGQRAVHYRQERGIREIRFAVVVQRLVEADVAGACFSVDPVSGSDERLIINANYGLGESVVGGLVTPDTFVIQREPLGVQSRQVAPKAQKIVPLGDGVGTVAVPEELRTLPCLSDQQALAVARLALQVEGAEGQAVDIEWAFAGGQLYLLQARPITARGASPDWVPETNTPINPRFPLYSRGNISEVLPGSVTPLTWDHTGKIIDRAFYKQLVELGAARPDGPLWQVMGFFYHRPYICVSFLAHAADQIPLMTPDTIYEEFIGPPETRTPPFGPRDLLPQRWPAWLRSLYVMLKKNLLLRREVEACTRVVMEQAQTCTSQALLDWDDAQLLETVRFSDDLVYPSVIHTWVSTFATVSFATLRAWTRAWLDDQDGSLAAGLVTGIDELVSAAPAHALYELAREVRAYPPLLALFQPEKSDQEILKALLKGPLRASIQDFLERFGHRAVGEAEFSRPCWREDPSQVIALLRNYLAEGSTSPKTIRERQQAAHRAALDRLDALNLLKRRLLQALTTRARQYIAYREHMKDLSILRADRSRRVYAELRRRLHERDLLRQPDDIFFLLWDDIQALATGQISASQAASISARRRQDYERCLRLSVPKLQQGQPRFLTVADHSTEQQLHGIGVSPGQVEGRARVILDPRLDSFIEPGEIIVAPVTDVAWTPLFLQAAGLVVEVGGLLSHGSVVAREYGLPAVVAVTGATQVIQTGERLLLDGNAGIVVKLAE